jgi:hypothetical protein
LSYFFLEVLASWDFGWRTGSARHSAQAPKSMRPCKVRLGQQNVKQVPRRPVITFSSPWQNAG